jgi:hypothetical protein
MMVGYPPMQAAGSEDEGSGSEAKFRARNSRTDEAGSSTDPLARNGRDQLQANAAHCKIADLLQQQAELQSKWVHLQMKHQEASGELQNKMQMVRVEYLQQLKLLKIPDGSQRGGTLHSRDAHSTHVMHTPSFTTFVHINPFRCSFYTTLSPCRHLVGIL